MAAVQVPRQKLYFGRSRLATPEFPSSLHSEAASCSLTANPSFSHYCELFSPLFFSHTYIIMAPLTAELSHLPKTDGSANFAYGGYTITAAVNGPVEAQRRDENPFEALVDVNVRPAAGVGGKQMNAPKQNSKRAVALMAEGFLKDSSLTSGVCNFRNW